MRYSPHAKFSTAKIMIYIGIVTYNSLADLPTCLESIKQQSWQRWRLYFLDNASTDGTVAWLRAQNYDVIESPRNLGYGCGHNRLLQEIHLQQGEDYYMPLNPDVILDADYLRELVGCLEKNEAAWAIGKLIQPNKNRLYSVGHALLWHGYAFNIAYDMPDAADYAVSREVFGASGACPLYTARLVLELSQKGYFFEPNFFMYGEDVELDWRARRQGWRCWYSPDALAQHRGSSPSSALKIEALANRYLAAIMHSEHLFAIILIMVLHCLLRILITPSEGVRLSASLIRRAPTHLQKRQSGQNLDVWFRWSAQQPSNQPLSWLDRMQRFFYNRRAM